jgi:hypothetical protein
MVTRKTWHLLVLAVVAGGLWAGRADAAPVLSVDPAAQVVNDGDTASINIRIDGIDATTGPIGYFEYVLSFDSTYVGTGLRLRDGHAELPGQQ